MEIQGKSSTDLPDRPEIFEFEGISMVEHFTKNWENVKNFQARPDDILIATYPKAVVFGSWFDHVCGWWEKKKTYPNLHYMLYEDMAKDIKGEVESLCTFLKLSRSDEEKEKIINGIQFDAMKQNKMTNYSTVLVMDFTISPFMRKGKVGDWKNHFTVAQNEQFNEDYKQKMKNSTLKFPTEHGRKTRGGRGRHVPSHPRLVPPPQKRKNLNYKKKNLNCEKYTYIYLK
nr:cytosolic sulfotransferase 1 isoform X2 [Danio rerio]|eukprot:XP_009302522.1 cytosolic sulfotransferase 1 isoform X2 [Danio rerio]